MRTLTTTIVPILLLHLLLAGSSAQAQPQFATVRLVTSWGKAATLFITKGQQPHRGAGMVATGPALYVKFRRNAAGIYPAPLWGLGHA